MINIGFLRGILLCTHVDVRIAKDFESLLHGERAGA